MHDFDLSVFAADYASARSRFLQAAASRGLETQTYAHPLSGPNGEILATDVAWLGKREVRRVLVLISATHGVEGFCGSGAQIDFMQSLPHIPEDAGVLLVHAINPHGFAWLRRVTEDGVDLNRNYVNFDEKLPENPGYDELADAIVPPFAEHDLFAAADARLEKYRECYGERAFESALSAGQYRHAHGLFYGGVAPTWSRRTSEAIVRDYHLAGRQRVALLDFHTGLGPFGYGEPICDHLPGSVGARLARAWYGDSVTEPALGTSSSVAKFGLSDYGWQQMVGEAMVFIALEFGTYPFTEMMRVLRSDHVLHRNELPDWHAESTRRIKAAIRRHFYPDTDDWKEAVLFRSRQCIRQALAGLAI